MERESGLSYLKYAIEQWGFFEGVSRWWKFHGSPKVMLERTKRAIRQFRLKDRRPRYPYGHLFVYAVDRDGDLYIIECPQCNKIQRLTIYRNSKHKPADYLCNSCPESSTHFHCHSCENGFSMDLEDGLRELKDFREGNPPLPTHTVCEPGTNEQYLGLKADAPWWWVRREVYRDLHEGKDAHGHEYYRTWFCPRASMSGQSESQMIQGQKAAE